MPLTGRKPKPEALRRNRVKPTHEWRDVADVPFADAPALPVVPGRVRGRPAPEPARPLGSVGHAFWVEMFADGTAELFGVPRLLMLCEQLDERAALRLRVLREHDPRERAALRMLDAQVDAAFAALAARRAAHPQRWPTATRHWWRAVSTMPHCVDWTATDWSFAVDTAQIAAAVHRGDLRWSSELRYRERVMGVTADARRDLRIRYVDPTPQEPDLSSVVAIEQYRQALKS